MEFQLRLYDQGAQNIYAVLVMSELEIAKAVAAVLPRSYNFEVQKTIDRIRQLGSKLVALQFPEGLLAYSLTLSELFNRFTGVECWILGDVTYGACCVDDFAAEAFGADLMVHYGHSCLIPVNVTRVSMLYVFVEIEIDAAHLIDSVRGNFPKESRVALSGTIQFAQAVRIAAKDLGEYFEEIVCPQEKPLSKAEVLGCTAPTFSSHIDTVIFVADGRFHMEALMIANPNVPRFYKYNPYDKSLVVEEYGHEEMQGMRKKAIEQARGAKRFGIILGTLGRQGNTGILTRLERAIVDAGRTKITILLSEITIEKLESFGDAVDAWIQIACPRLSIDWGYAFQERPLLTPYEAMVALEQAQWQEVYPMDNYSAKGGPWANYYDRAKPTKSGGDKSALKARIKAARARKAIELTE